MAQVNVDDILARARDEFPGVRVELNDVARDRMEATFVVKAGNRARECWERIKMLNLKAKLFNAHFELGHRSRKTNWWNIE